MGFHVALIFSSFLLASPVPAAVPPVSKVAGVWLTSPNSTTFTVNGAKTTVPDITAPSVGTYSMTAYTGIDVVSPCQTTLEAGFNCSITQHEPAECHFWYSVLGNITLVNLAISPNDTVFMEVSTEYQSSQGGAVLLVNENGENGWESFSTNVTSSMGFFCGRSVGWFVRTDDFVQVPHFDTMVFTDAIALGPQKCQSYGPQTPGAANTTISRNEFVAVEPKPGNNSITFIQDWWAGCC